MDLEKTRKAGVIVRDTIAYARTHIKKGMLLKDIAEEIENFIRARGAQPAFPVNLSINEMAAHVTPSHDDTSVAHGLLKVDIGAHIDGCAVDTAFSLNLDNVSEHKKLIQAAEDSLAEALKLIRKGVQTTELGETIEREINKHGAVPIRNLTGHSIEEWDVHAGISIPNCASARSVALQDGVYAIEPFSTFGLGRVRDGKLSGIYHLVKPVSVRDPMARQVMNYIVEHYQQLPFCSRWIHAKFGGRGLLALKQIEQAGGLYHFSQLVEESGGVVAQAEHTVLIGKNGVEILTQ